jgi:hypothetical protein
MKKSILPILAVLALFVVVFVLFLLHGTGLLFGLVGLPHGELLSEVASPNGDWTVSIYQTSGGATVDFAVRGELTNRAAHQKKNIYWAYHESTAVVIWQDDDTVLINDVVLDVRTQTYDWRVDQR